MGYGNLRGVVEANRDTLELILQACLTGKPLELEVAPGESADNTRWHVRRMLVATSEFPEEAGGAYRGLEKRVLLRVRRSHETGRSYIMVSSKPVAASQKPLLLDETLPLQVQLVTLASEPGDSFVFILSAAEAASLDFLALSAQCARLGWEVASTPYQLPDGRVKLYAQTSEVEARSREERGIARFFAPRNQRGAYRSRPEMLGDGGEETQSA